MATLLIVEDDHKTSDAICEYLKPTGHSLIPAYDGSEALQLFRENSIDLVVLDIKCFREIFLIGGTHPNENIYMLQHFLNNSFENLNYAKLSVASVLLLIVVLIVFAVFYIFVRRKEAFRA